MTTGPQTKHPRMPRPPFRNILVPTDVSMIGNSAIPLAYELAMRGGTVHLLHVCRPPLYGNPMYGDYTDGFVPTAEDIKFGRAKIHAALQRLPPKNAESNGIQTALHILDGVNVSQVVEDLAHEVDADVVVMATRGRTGLARMLGSIATDVLKKDDLAVILVHQCAGA